VSPRTNLLSSVLRARSAAHQGAFVPFLVLGDPTLEVSERLCDELVAAGADALELGFPFSDPPADGPVLQAAATRALRSGSTTARCFQMIAALRRRHDVPVSLLLYVNLIVQMGIDAFYARCADVGVDAVLIADVPLEEAAPFVSSARAHGVAPVFLASALSSPRRLARIAELAEHGAYLYAVARVGITGEQTGVDPSLSPTLRRLRAAVPLPILAGFGIATATHVEAVRAAGADGVIVGSALVRHIESATSPDAIVASLGRHARILATAAHAPLLEVTISKEGDGPC
jgi:tryptophan synthase alpha chain